MKSIVTILLQISVVTNTLVVVCSFSTISTPLRIRMYAPPLAYHLHKPFHTNSHYHPNWSRQQFFPINQKCLCPLSRSTTERFSAAEEIYANYVNEKRREKELVDNDGFAPFDETGAAWEECVRRMATDSLVPVFYLAEGYEKVHKQTTISPEKALKKLLRRFQKIILTEPTMTYEERAATRKRLSHLILGTSVMRLWYHHLYSLMIQQSDDDKEVEPLHNTPASVGDDIPTRKSPVTEYMSRVDTVRAMVDLHVKYTLPNTITTIAACRSAEEISIRRSLPLFLSKMISDQYGIEKADTIAHSFNSPGPVTLRRNAIKCASDDVLIERLWKDEAAKVVRLESLAIQHDGATTFHQSPSVPNGCLRLLPWANEEQPNPSIWSMSAWLDGWFEVQDAGSQFIVDAIEAKSGQTIIDYCAGNGGKTFALASRMHADETDNISDISPSRMESPQLSSIIAHDIDPDRLKRLNGSFKRIGLSESDITIVTTSDAQDLQRYSADAILVDAPCSSSGVLRRRPSHRFQMTEQEIRVVFPQLQLEILTDAAKMVKVGGRLVYATCSILSYENEDVVDAFESLKGFGNWIRWSYCAGVDDGDAEDDSVICGRPHCRALLPSNHECDGFFVARWKRIS